LPKDIFLFSFLRLLVEYNAPSGRISRFRHSFQFSVFGATDILQNSNCPNQNNQIQLRTTCNVFIRLLLSIFLRFAAIISLVDVHIWLVVSTFQRVLAIITAIQFFLMLTSGQFCKFSNDNRHYYSKLLPKSLLINIRYSVSKVITVSSACITFILKIFEFVPILF
jgi:hypothetical protein